MKKKPVEETERISPGVGERRKAAILGRSESPVTKRAGRRDRGNRGSADSWGEKKKGCFSNRIHPGSIRSIGN